MRQGLKLTGAVMVPTAFLAMATGCTAGGNDNEPTTAATTTTAVASTTPADALSVYLHSPDRVQRLDSTMQRVGKLILAQSRNPKGSWGPFIIQCDDGFSNGATIPYANRQPKDDCMLATKDEAFGGKKHKVSVIAWRTVLPSKRLATSFDGVSVNGVGMCKEASISSGFGSDAIYTESGINATGPRKGLVTNVSEGRPEEAPTKALAEAKRADAGVLACFSTLKP